MAQPDDYEVQTDFSSEESNSVAGRSEVRTSALDAEFSAIATTIAQILVNLALIQRDDTELLDGTVKLHTLSAEVRALIASSAFTVRGTWVTATAYALGDIVIRTGVVYICTTAHTSGVFADDLVAEKWGPLTFVQTASDTPFSATSTLQSTNVQAAIAELDSDLRAPINLIKRELFGGL
jgi:hypothetical protein